VVAHTVSQVIAGLVGLLLLFVFIKFQNVSKESFSWDILKNFLAYGLPLSIGTLFHGVLAQIYQYIMVLYVTTDLIGNYGAAVTFGTLVSLLTGPISTTLFPLYSKFKRGDPELKAIFQTAVKYTAMVTLPASLAIIAVAEPLARILFGVNDYPYVPLYLSVYILNYAWEGLGGISLGTLISGIGESKISLRSSILTFATGLILALILVPRFGMVGILVTIVLDSRGGWLHNTIWVKKNLGITVNWGSTARIYIVGFIAFAAAYIVTTHVGLQGWLALISGVSTYFIVYLIGLPVGGAIKRSDMRLIETTINAKGALAPIIHRVISLISKFVKE